MQAWGVDVVWRTSSYREMEGVSEDYLVNVIVLKHETDAKWASLRVIAPGRMEVAKAILDVWLARYVPPGGPHSLYDEGELKKVFIEKS